jgi:hypothetical protein
MRKKLAALLVAFGAALTIVAPALPFTIVNPVTGECRQVLVPGPATFPGNWEVVSATPAAGPGPWNGSPALVVVGDVVALASRLAANEHLGVSAA